MPARCVSMGHTSDEAYSVSDLLDLQARLSVHRVIPAVH